MVCRYTYTGTQTGPDKNYPATGKGVTLPGVSIYKVVNGKIAEIWRYFDMADWMKQLGFTITPPSATGEN